ncbi:adenylate kinase family protein [Patescibacteria group bacterium]
MKKLTPRKHIILLGPQGSGKGTQAKYIAKMFHVSHIEMGALIRIVSREKSALGKRINHIMNKEGRLISDSVVGKILTKKLLSTPKNKGIVFDGFPRNITQARMLDRLLSRFDRELTLVIYLPLSQRSTIKRLSLRRSCAKCGTSWILGKTLAKKQTKCPKCGGDIIHRKDDQPQTIKKRLAEYIHKTRPIINFYKQRKILITVNGESSIPIVWKKIKKQLHDHH